MTDFLLTMLSIILQSSHFEVYAMDFTEDFVHSSINSPPLARLQPRERRVFVDVAGAVFHQVEWGANETRMTGLKQQNFSDRPQRLVEYSCICCISIKN